MTETAQLRMLTERVLAAVDQLVAPHTSNLADHVSTVLALLGAALIRSTRRTRDPIETLRITIEGLQQALNIMQGRARRGGTSGPQT